VRQAALPHLPPDLPRQPPTPPTSPAVCRQHRVEGSLCSQCCSTTAPILIKSGVAQQHWLPPHRLPSTASCYCGWSSLRHPLPLPGPALPRGRRNIQLNNTNSHPHTYQSYLQCQVPTRLCSSRTVPPVSIKAYQQLDAQHI
jgi:hypothetical protein